MHALYFCIRWCDITTFTVKGAYEFVYDQHVDDHNGVARRFVIFLPNLLSTSNYAIAIDSTKEMESILRGRGPRACSFGFAGDAKECTWIPPSSRQPTRFGVSVSVQVSTLG